jgi:hypothetical protein
LVFTSLVTPLLTPHHRSIEFLSDYGAHALCCPLQRVPVARIAAAQTEIRATNRCEQCAAYRIRGVLYVRAYIECAGPLWYS